MNDDEFEWDDAKAASNLAKHGVSFEDARRVFDDAFASDQPDDRFDYGEERFSITGMVDGALITVAYSMRGDRYRLISARTADRYEQDRYFREAIS